MQQQNLLKPINFDPKLNSSSWQNLPGASASLAAASYIEKTPTLHVILVADALKAWQIEAELRFFLKEKSVLPILHFPEWETLPYDIFSPYQDIISERLKTLQQIKQTKHAVLITTINALMNRLPPASFIHSHSFFLSIGHTIHLDSLRANLVNSGYRQVAQVYEHGEYAIRGSIFDIFPMGSDLPFRIELFDDEIETIRTFDLETQRSLEKLEKIELLPAHEFPLTEQAISAFRSRFREQFTINPTECALYQDISEGLPSPGTEYYLPLFFDETANLIDYLPKEAITYRWGNIHDKSQQYWQEIQHRYEQLAHDITRPILPPTQAFFSTSEVFAKLNQLQQIEIQSHDTEQVKTNIIHFACEIIPDIHIETKSVQPLKALQNYLHTTDHRILFCAETNGRREILLGLLADIAVKPMLVDSWQEFLTCNERYCLIVHQLDQGLVDSLNKITLLTENQLLGERITQQRRRKQATSDNVDQIIRSLAELKINDPVVHIEHGVGRYLGLQTLTIGELTAEYLLLEYAEQTKLYLPVSSLHLINRYSGVQSDHVPLHRLGSDQWEKAKKKAAEKIYDVAAELLDIYARRALHEGHHFNIDTDYQKFAQDFPFEETPDQEKAINQIIADMASNKPMDRLVCGDVGFGKTEVAMRAAFIAVSNHKQVAVLAPTTLLAQQHFQTFSDRFANWPIKIEVLSRFKTAKEQTVIMEQMKSGKIDIIIGTHKLLNESMDFSRLGLLIIDEEHRFGVKQKEKLKSIRTNLDILALTATPIPRTLNMSFAGMRDLSIIATAPAKRLAIKTFVMQKQAQLTREAILREILRGGQVYYLHNDVSTIEQTAKELKELVTEAQVVIGHGQMPERELERVMTDFYHRRYNVLVCTTIIETGIDIPSANTIIIERADKFGLAQLHQLRGRVGRSHHQAYAYLLIPHRNALTADAEKRLEAISQHEELGAGFILATHDLEIRGAGELLGEDQSGQIQEVGFSMYMEMLERAVSAMKAGNKIDLTKPLHSGTEIDLKMNAYIPEDYLPDVHTRLILYKRIANAENQTALNDLQAEMIDRFGTLPQAAKNLFQITSLKLIAEPIGIKKIEANLQGGRIYFTAAPKVDPARIIQLIQTKSKEFQFDGADKLKFAFIPAAKPETLIEQIGLMIQSLV